MVSRVLNIERERQGGHRFLQILRDDRTRNELFERQSVAKDGHFDLLLAAGRRARGEGRVADDREEWMVVGVSKTPTLDKRLDGGRGQVKLRPNEAERRLDSCRSVDRLREGRNGKWGSRREGNERDVEAVGLPRGVDKGGLGVEPGVRRAAGRPIVIRHVEVDDFDGAVEVEMRDRLERGLVVERSLFQPALGRQG